jgi:hypothetical protein
MSYDDDYDDDGGDVAESAPVATDPVNVPDVAVAFTVSAKQMEQAIKGQVANQVASAFKAFIDKRVSDTVSELVREIGRDQVDAQVRAILAEGWQKTDDYGQARGGRVSLRERVQEMFHKADRYESRSMFERVIKEELDKALKGELGKELEAARAKIRSEVDQITRAKLNESLKAALGLGA